MKSVFQNAGRLAAQSLLFQILGLSVLFTILLTVTIGAFAYFLSASVIKTDTRDKLAAIALVKEDNLNRWVDEQKRNLVFIAALPGVRAEAGQIVSGEASLPTRQEAADLLTEYFRTVIGTAADSQEILLLDTNGKVLIASTPTHIGLIQSQEAYFQKGLTNTAVTSFYVSPLLGTPTITVSTPLFDTNGRRVGVLASHLSLAAVDQIIRERSSLSESGEIYLVNPQRQLVTIDPLAGSDNKPLHSAGIDAALEKQRGSGLYANYAGLPVIGAYQWIPERDVALIVEVSQAEALSPMQRLGRWTLLMSVIVITASSLILSAFLQRFIHPIEILTQTATEIASGNLELEAPVTNENEVGRLAIAFNVMTRELKKTLRSMEKLNDELETRVDDRTIELSASNRELEAFSYSISHDLRAPLRAISGYSRILLNDFSREFSAEANSMLEKINENSIYMGKLVDGLLAFSRLGRQALRPQHISASLLTDLIDKIIQELKMDHSLAHINVEIGTLQPCLADPLLLHQVYINLISNAFKFSHKLPEAQVEIGVTLTKKGPAYFVRDNGAGFNMQYVDKLFGVFQRLHHQSEFEGTGVGLAIVQRIIHRHKGEIWAESKPGQGATFYWTLGLQAGENLDCSDEKTE